MSCRFPGARDLDELWRLLERGGDAIGELPEWRWDREARGAAGAGRFGGFIAGIDGFDASFFGISGREAARMDPQQRLFLEQAWVALEDAGITPSSLAGSETGVFAGVSSHD